MHFQNINSFNISPVTAFPLLLVLSLALTSPLWCKSVVVPCSSWQAGGAGSAAALRAEALLRV